MYHTGFLKHNHEMLNVGKNSKNEKICKEVISNFLLLANPQINRKDILKRCNVIICTHDAKFD